MRKVVREVANTGGQRRWSWTPNRNDAFILMTKGYEPADIARQLSLNRVTVWRWHKRPEWRSRLVALLRSGEGIRPARRRVLVARIVDEGVAEVNEVRRKAASAPEVTAAERFLLAAMQLEQEVFRS